MRSTALLLPLALTALPFLACSSDKDHAERNAAPEAQGLNPDFYDLDNPDPVALEMKIRAKCVGACTPDPGSKPVDVAKAEAGYQFAWLWDLTPNGENKAWATFTYDDNTTDFVLPLRARSSTGYGWGGWEPKGDPVPAGQGPAYAARFRGGPFTEYGGGIGVTLRSVSNTVDPAASTHRETNPNIQLLEQTPSKEFPDPSAGAYDLGSYEGVAIWVRRGPDGQSTMRLGITERNSAEDLNSSAIRNSSSAPAFQDITQNVPPGIFEGKYCKRWRICGCSGGTPCTLVAGTADEYRCYDPSLETPAMNDLLGDQIKYPHCGTRRCKDPNSSTLGPDSDPLFHDKSCSEALQSDGHSDSFCYDPDKDPTPPAKRERCNNPYSRPITVTTDWQLIKVPFSELRQADEAKVSGEMDLHSVKQFVATYGGGWIDFWVANVGFYRKL